MSEYRKDDGTRFAPAEARYPLTVPSLGLTYDRKEDNDEDGRWFVTHVRTEEKS